MTAAFDAQYVAFDIFLDKPIYIYQYKLTSL